jgi:DNA modification methylase
VACLLEGRRFLGAEIDPGTFLMARQRLEGVDAEGEPR